MTEPTRLDLLRTYLARLSEDQAKAGKFTGRGENRIESTVDAILNGGGAMAQQLWADLKEIGGEKAIMAAPLVEAVIAGAAADATKQAIGWVGAQLKDLANGGPAKRKQAQAGRAIMDTARKMGGNRK